MRTNDTTNWRRRLAGEIIPIIDGEPEYGFYRVRTRDKTSWRPVAYWYAEDDTLRCRLAGQDLDQQSAAELWPWASQHPISHETYGAVTRGEPWPDLNDVVTLSNRAPPDDSLEALQEAIDDLGREAERLIKAGAAKTEDAANQAADVANKLGELREKADKARKAEKQPHWDAGCAVDDKWRPIITAADIYTRLKEIVCTPFLRAEKAKKDARVAEERRKAGEIAAAARAADEAARKAVEAAEKMAGGEHDREAAEAAQVAQAEAARQAEAAHEAEQRVRDVASAPVTVGTRGRSVGLRGTTIATIVDRAAVFAFFDGQESTRDLITELLQKMVNAAVKAKITVPGVKTDKDAKAA